MGSAGSGRFGTYRIGGNSDLNDVRNGVNRISEVECPKIIENIRLEDVATSELFAKHHTLPAVHSRVQLRNTIHLGRLVVETSDTYEVIGNLPVQYNYLINCIKVMTYSGKVVSSGISPIPYVVVTLYA